MWVEDVLEKDVWSWSRPRPVQVQVQARVRVLAPWLAQSCAQCKHPHPAYPYPAYASVSVLLADSSMLRSLSAAALPRPFPSAIPMPFASPPTTVLIE